MKIPRLLLILVFVFSISSVTAVFAYQPIFNEKGSPSIDEAFLIEEPELSSIIFGTLKSSNRIDYYRIDVPVGKTLWFQLFTPATCEGFKPEMVLIGSDIVANKTVVNLEIPKGMEARTFTEQQWGTYFDRTDPTLYQAGPAFQHTAQSTTYYIAVYHPENQAGTYLLSMSGLEATVEESEWRAQKDTFNACLEGIVQRINTLKKLKTYVEPLAGDLARDNSSIETVN